jgi:hypothetical protein
MPSASQPKPPMQLSNWDEQVEDAYRFQQAGYKNETEYREIQKTDHVDRWPQNGFVKKLVARDGYFYYYNKTRECPDTQINNTRLFSY